MKTPRRGRLDRASLCLSTEYCVHDLQTYALSFSVPSSLPPGSSAWYVGGNPSNRLQSQRLRDWWPLGKGVWCSPQSCAEPSCAHPQRRGFSAPLSTEEISFFDCRRRQAPSFAVWPSHHTSCCDTWDSAFKHLSPEDRCCPWNAALVSYASALWCDPFSFKVLPCLQARD